MHPCYHTNTFPVRNRLVNAIISDCLPFYRCTRSESVTIRPPPPPKRRRMRDKERGKAWSEEELEMKSTAQQHDDYYFEDPSNIGIYTTSMIGLQ